MEHGAHIAYGLGQIRRHYRRQCQVFLDQWLSVYNTKSSIQSRGVGAKSIQIMHKSQYN